MRSSNATVRDVIGSINFSSGRDKSVVDMLKAGKDKVLKIFESWPKEFGIFLGLTVESAKVESTKSIIEQHILKPVSGGYSVMMPRLAEYQLAQAVLSHNNLISKQLDKEIERLSAFENAMNRWLEKNNDDRKVALRRLAEQSLLSHEISAKIATLLDALDTTSDYWRLGSLFFELIKSIESMKPKLVINPETFELTVLAETKAYGRGSEKLKPLVNELVGDEHYRYLLAGYAVEGDKSKCYVPETPEARAFEARDARRRQLYQFHRNSNHDKRTQTLLPSKEDMGKGSSVLPGDAKPIQKFRSVESGFYDIEGNCYVTDKQPQGPFIDVQAVKRHQNGLKIYVDFKNIRALLDAAGIKDKSVEQVVRDIQLIKNGLTKDVIKPSQASDLEDYKYRILEPISSFVVMRGVVHQHYEFDGTPIPGAGRATPVYYLTFPKLRGTKTRASADFNAFCDAHSNGSGRDGTLKKDKIDALRNRYKDIILLGMRVASIHGEGVDIVTPHAFFSGLNPGAQREAKGVFAEAVVEAAQAFKPLEDDKGIAYLSVHDDNASKMREKVHDATGKLVVPVLVAENDATSPCRAAAKLNASSSASHIPTCAVSIMGEGLGVVGNEALGGAQKAMEENFTRVCSGEISLVFSAYNSRVLEIADTLVEQARGECLTALQPDNSGTHIATVKERHKKAIQTLVDNFSKVKGEMPSVLEAKIKALHDIFIEINKDDAPLKEERDHGKFTLFYTRDKYGKTQSYSDALKSIKGCVLTILRAMNSNNQKFNDAKRLTEVREILGEHRNRNKSGETRSLRNKAFVEINDRQPSLTQ